MDSGEGAGQAPERHCRPGGRRLRRMMVIAFVAVLGGCAVAVPTGPRVLAVPAAGKSFEQFRQEEANCRAYAQGLSGDGAAAQAVNGRAAGAAAARVGLGAAAGALIGSASANAGAGAAIGAGVGLLAGTARAARVARRGTAELQRRYDAAYAQCMVAQGNGIATPGVAVVAPAAVYYPAGG